MYVIFIIMMVIGAIVGATVGFQIAYIRNVSNEIKKQEEYISKYSDELFGRHD